MAVRCCYYTHRALSAVGDALFNADNNLCLVLESYITHIRIIEDAAHPSSPPPPNSSPDNKKPRLIIVAVRKSGRVRMHKARENSNGTFSIGKTWVLDDLTCIESFAGAAPSTEEEEARRQSAGGTGFTVTVQKPYYWQAATAKEKDFFIASLIKIYRKYTGGRLPQLISFDPRALEQLAVPSGQQARSNSPSARSETTISPQRPPSAQATQPPSSYTTRELTRDADVEPRKRPSEERFLSRSDSQDHMQTPPGFFPGSDLTQPSSLPVSQTQLRSAGASSPSNANTPPGLLKTPPLSHNEPNLRRLAGTQSVESSRSGNDPLDGRLVPSSSIDRLRSNGKPLSGSRGVYSGFQRSMSPESNYNSPTTTSSVPPPFHSHQNLLPERRRPPIAGSMNSYGQENLDAEFHDNYSTPLSSPDLRREEARPPSRSRDRPRFAGSNSLIASGPAEHSLQTTRQENPNLEMSSAATPDTMDSASLASTKSDKIFTTAPVLTATTVPTPPPEPPTQSEEEVHRPGLGPMIKKKSNKEIANTFRKAATAYNAFKPRAGGAGDKLREEKDKGASGPNGITGVVPAPSFSRTTSQDSVRTPTVEEAIVNLPTLPEAKQGPPAVQITEAADEVPKNSLSGLAAEVSEPRAPSPGKSRSKSPQTQEDRRTKRRSGNSAKYAAALGIDPNLLEGGTVDIESVLADFGWGSEGLSTKKVDELQAEMRREIGRFEAGSWLGHLEQKDERVETVDRMLDKAIAECDALEGLLTLYGVELGVSHSHIHLRQSRQLES